MDELMNHSLREQERGLRVVMATFSRAQERMARLGGNVGWIGPASDEYELGVYTLRAEMRMAEDRLAAALAGTTNALTVSASHSGG